MDCNVGLSKEILKEWSNAVANSQMGYYECVKDFKEKYNQEYKLITAMYRKRVVLHECLEIMQDMNEPIYWFTLTFNNKKDNNTIESKRKEAQRFLNALTICYVMVEEFGEDNGRYHIHGFLCFKYGFGFVDFVSWHSRQKIELMDDKKIKKKVRYLTKYAVKQVPRIRKSKTMCKLYNYAHHHKGLKSCFKSVYDTDFKQVVESVVNPF